MRQHNPLVVVTHLHFILAMSMRSPYGCLDDIVSSNNTYNHTLHSVIQFARMHTFDTYHGFNLNPSMETSRHRNPNHNRRFRINAETLRSFHIVLQATPAFPSTWSYLTCRIGHCVHIWQPLAGPSFHLWHLQQQSRRPRQEHADLVAPVRRLVESVPRRGVGHREADRRPRPCLRAMTDRRSSRRRALQAPCIYLCD
jgi:hypothetical protein